MFPANRQRNKGAILPMMAVGIVTLVGIAALVLDLGRLFVLKTEMQNAADAAALAAAAELDGLEGAQAAAIAAAKGRLQHLTNQAQTSELLANLTDDAFEFYSYIGSEFDLTKPNPCNAVEGGEKCLASGDADSYYVRVTLDTDTVGETGSYVVDLFFLPVLKIFGVDAAEEASTAASAVAGTKAKYMCEYPPMMICNPFESEGLTVAQALAQGKIKVGDEVRLQSSASVGFWAPGDFGFLQPFEDGKYLTGAKDLGEGIEDPTDQECTTMKVCTQPGLIESQPIWGMNTRFDIQTGPYNEPSAPNIMAYPEDLCFDGGSCVKFGDGEWGLDDAGGYWDQYHQWGTNHPQLNPATSAPGDLIDGGDLDTDGDGRVTRWEVYNWEMSSGWMPCNPALEPDCSSLAGPTPMSCNADGDCTRPSNYPVPNPLPVQDLDPDKNSPLPLEPLVAHGYPDWDSGTRNLNRRILYVAVLDCTAQNIKGSTCGYANEIAKFFLIERAPQGSSEFNYVAEFLGLATVDTDPDVLHEVIQLYE